MDKENIISTIDRTIKNRRVEVIKALINSDVVLPEAPSDYDLQQIIINESLNRNGYVIFNVGEVISKEIGEEKKSGIVPLVGAALISTGGGLLGSIVGMFGGGGGDAEREAKKAAQQQYSAKLAREAAMKKQMIIAASQANAQQINANTATQNKKSSINRTMLVVGMVSGAVIIGTTIAVLIFKK